MLGLQQICGGCSDAMKLLTFLNLPNGESMKANKFKRIEDSIGDVIRNEAKKKHSKCIGRGGETYVRIRKEGN